MINFRFGFFADSYEKEQPGKRLNTFNFVLYNAQKSKFAFSQLFILI